MTDGDTSLDVEVPRDPLHINTDTGKKTKAMDIQSHPLQSCNLLTNAHNTCNILVICAPNNSLGTEGINEGLQRQQDS